MRRQILSIVPALALVLLSALSPASFAEEPEGMVFVKNGDAGFYIDKYLVTQEAYLKVMGINLSRHHNCPTCPVEQVNMDEAMQYCGKLGKVLPSEADWEYAASSGGKNEIWAGTSNESERGDYAWFKDNSGGKSHPVGEKKPNGLGLYDMSGNLWQWMNSEKLRGGSWNHDANDLRHNYTGMYAIEGRYTYAGFRCVKY